MSTSRRSAVRPSGLSHQSTVSHETIAKNGERHRVHLLVHHRLVPHRERRGAEQRRRGRAGDALPPLREPHAQHALDDEEPRSRRHRAAERREHVDARRRVAADRQDRKDVRDQNEKWIARRMRNAEHLRGGNVFARVPHRRRRRERGDVQREDDERNDCGDAVRRWLLRGSRRICAR